MSNVIDLFSEREKRTAQPVHDTFEFSVDVFTAPDGEVSGRAFNFDLEDGLTDADRLRQMAERLEKLAVILHDQATALEPNDDGFILGRIKVFESSRVRAWYADRVSTEESFVWMEERLDDAKTIIRPSPQGAA